MNVYMHYATGLGTVDKQYNDNCKLSERIRDLRVTRYRESVDGVHTFSWDEAKSFFKGSQCEDPKDKVYGLLGLVDESLKVAPDYNKSLEAVFEDMIYKQARCGKSNFSDWKVWASRGEKNLDWERVTKTGSLRKADMKNCKLRQVFLDITFIRDGEFTIPLSTRRKPIHFSFLSCLRYP
jgi:hypothetical protein